MSTTVSILVTFVLVAGLASACTFPDETQGRWDEYSRSYKLGTSEIGQHKITSTGIMDIVTDCVGQDGGLFLLQNKYMTYCVRMEPRDSGSRLQVHMYATFRAAQGAASGNWADVCRDKTYPRKTIELTKSKHR